MSLLRARSRGQTLVLFTVFIVVAAMMLSLSFFLYSAKRQRDAAEEIARAAVRAGCMQVDEEKMGRGIVWLDEERARSAALEVLRNGLPYLPYGLSGGATPESIVAGAELYVVNATPGEPRESPLSHKVYDRPFVAIRFVVPTATFFVPIDLGIAQEDTTFLRVTP